MSSKKLWWQMSLQVYILGSEVPSPSWASGFSQFVPLFSEWMRGYWRFILITAKDKESRLVSSLTKLLPSLANSSWGLHENPLGDREMMSEHHDDGRKHLLSTYWIRLYSLTSHGRKAWIKVQLTFGN